MPSAMLVQFRAANSSSAPEARRADQDLAAAPQASSEPPVRPRRPVDAPAAVAAVRVRRWRSATDRSHITAMTVTAAMNEPRRGAGGQHGSAQPYRKPGEQPSGSSTIGDSVQRGEH